MSEIHLAAPLSTHPESTPESVQERNAMLARLRTMTPEGATPPTPAEVEEEKLARARAVIPEGPAAEEEINGEEEEEPVAPRPALRSTVKAPAMADALSRDGGKGEPRAVVTLKNAALGSMALQVHEVLIGERFIHILAPNTLQWKPPMEIEVAMEFQGKTYQVAGVCEYIKLPGGDRGLLSFVRVDDTPADA